MTTQDPKRPGESGNARPPILSAALLLVLYIVMYLSVGAVMHVFDPAPAETAVSDSGAASAPTD